MFTYMQHFIISIFLYVVNMLFNETDSLIIIVDNNIIQTVFKSFQLDFDIISHM